MNVQPLEISYTGEKDSTSTPITQQKNSWLKTLDLFSFLPVPKTAPVSSKRSMLGSLIMLIVFFLYMIFNFLDFVYNNAPRVNQYTRVLGLQNVTLPKIAFAFFYGDPFTSTINDPTILTFQMDQIYKSQNLSIPDVKISIPLISCRPDWVPDQGYALLCPQNDTIMLGALYRSQSYGYPRIVVNLCKQGPNITCINETQMAATCAGGRILLFIQDNGPNIDLNSGQQLTGSSYKVFQIFLIRGLYPRGQIIFSKSSFTVKPDYLRRWVTQESEYLQYHNFDISQTNVSIYNTALVYQIQFTVDQQQVVDILVYATLLDQIAKWGAFWGVLFAVFAAYLLNYNSQHFYKENQVWENFDQKIGLKRRQSEGGDIASISRMSIDFGKNTFSKRSVEDSQVQK